MKLAPLEDIELQTNIDEAKIIAQIASIDAVMNLIGQQAVQLMDEYKRLLEQLRMIHYTEDDIDPYVDA